MRNNLFLNINKTSTQETNISVEPNDKKKVKSHLKHSTVNKLNAIKENNIIENIFDYVKTRVEIGMISPIELVDVYGHSTYIGIIIPETIDFRLQEKIIHAKKSDFIIFDFDDNISYITKDNFRSFYRMSKASKSQQLLSVIRLFKLNITAEQLSIKQTVNEFAHIEEDAIFKELAEQIMKGNTDKRLTRAYKRVIESKYKNDLINYTVLSGYKAKYYMSLLKKKNIPFALLTPLVDSIVDMDDELDIDKIATVNSYVALIATVANGTMVNQVASCLKQMNEDLNGEIANIDTLTYTELISFKSQLDSGYISLSGSIADKVLAQIKEEVVEQHEMFGENDVLVQDIDDFIK
jgi:hypothetical protein